MEVKQMNDSNDDKSERQFLRKMLAEQFDDEVKDIKVELKEQSRSLQRVEIQLATFNNDKVWAKRLLTIIIAISGANGVKTTYDVVRGAELTQSEASTSQRTLTNEGSQASHDVATRSEPGSQISSK